MEKWFPILSLEISDMGVEDEMCEKVRCEASSRVNCYLGDHKKN
jgi:hypothetical protein